MAGCIFCLSETRSYTTIEHIIPQSLCGDCGPILDKGVLCDGCQNYFGAKIEKVALQNYPFSHWRISSGILTKKSKPPFFEEVEGQFFGGPEGISVAFRPEFHLAALQGRKTQLRLLAEPSNKRIECRFVCKMGLETLYAERLDTVQSEKYSEIRRFARFGDQSLDWWFMIYYPRAEAAAHPLETFTMDLDDRDFMFGIEGLGIAGIHVGVAAPLSRRIEPPAESAISDYGLRVYRV